MGNVDLAVKQEQENKMALGCKVVAAAATKTRQLVQQLYRCYTAAQHLEKYCRTLIVELTVCTADGVKTKTNRWEYVLLRWLGLHSLSTILRLLSNWLSILLLLVASSLVSFKVIIQHTLGSINFAILCHVRYQVFVKLRSFPFALLFPDFVLLCVCEIIKLLSLWQKAWSSGTSVTPSSSTPA